MSNIQSQYIKIFPLAKPRKNNIASRLFYEQNVTNLLRQLMDTEGFIIQPCEIDNNTCKGDLIFNLYGYYFEIKSGTNLGDLSTGKYIIANILLSSQEPIEIEGQDEQKEDTYFYTGLEINCTDDISNKNSNVKSLILFEKNDSDNWEIYKPSLNKFDVRSLLISGIDGKH